MGRFLLWLVLAVNLVAFAAMGIDKLLARLGRRRVPEAVLLWLAFLTGALGVWAASGLFRHKTVKSSFRRKLLLATLANVLWIVLWRRLGVD